MAIMTRSGISEESATMAAVSALEAAFAIPIQEEPAVKAAAARMAELDAVAVAAERPRDQFEADATRRTRDGASDAAALDAVEHLPGARIGAARARWEANVAKVSHDETVKAARERRRARLDEVERAVRERVLEGGETFQTLMEVARTIDRLGHELLTPDEKWVDAMVPGGAFAKLAIVSPEALRARLDALRALGHD